MTTPDRVARHLDTTDTVTIVTHRKDGSAVPTFIWSASVDGVGYVRSAFGPGSWWWRRATSGRPVEFDLGVDGEVADAGTVDPVATRVEVVPVDDEHVALHAAIDAALTAKYDYTPENLAPMLTAEATACTLRVVEA